MSDLFDNPLGLDGFEFLEFCAPEKGVLEQAFELMGFSLVARHRSKDVQLWRQGQINFVANYEPKSPAAYFSAEHGPSADEMQKLHNQLLNDSVRMRQSSQARAQQIAEFTLYDGDPELINSELQELMSITAAQIKEAVHKYLGTENRALLDVVTVGQAA